MALKQTTVINTENNLLKELLQKQVEHEFDNERLYLSMALWCAMKGFVQTANFFSGHALEERNHGMDFINAMIIQRIAVKTPYTTDVPREFADLRDVLVQSLEREKETSKMIGEIYKTAVGEGSVIAEVAGKYMKEQEEEEQLFTSILNLHKLCNGSIIDFEMEISQIKCSGKYKVGSL